MGEILFGTKYSRINQVKFVEDSPPPKKIEMIYSAWPSKICGRQPLTNLKWYGLRKQIF